MGAEQQIKDLGLELPRAGGPAGNYVTTVRTGNLLYIAGKAPPAVNGVAPKGKLGREYATAQGYAFARAACLEVLAAIKAALGSLDQVAQVVDLHGSINAVPEFEEHAQVLDGASDLLASVFGPAGLHVRSVVGVSSLRNGLPLTLKVIVEVKP